jgi:hypothetical protein
MSVKDELSELDLLYAILRYCTLKGRYFNIGERICINQKRGRLMAQQSAIDNDEIIDYESFEFSDQLIRKIDFVTSKIDNQKSIIYELFNPANC